MGDVRKCIRGCKIPPFPEIVWDMSGRGAPKHLHLSCRKGSILDLTLCEFTGRVKQNCSTTQGRLCGWLVQARALPVAGLQEERLGPGYLEAAQLTWGGAGAPREAHRPGPWVQEQRRLRVTSGELGDFHHKWFFACLPWKRPE